MNGLDTNTSLTQQQKSSKSSSSSKNDSSTPSAQQLLSFLSARESIEYEPFDAALAGRVTSLYAQLESLTTTVAQMRRDAPAKAAREYADALKGALAEDDEWSEEEENVNNNKNTTSAPDGDIDMKDSKERGGESERIKRQGSKTNNWQLNIDFGSEREQDRWREGEMGEVYADTLKTLVRLQGEVDDSNDTDEGGSRGLATTVGRVERARTAAEVVENM